MLKINKSITETGCFNIPVLNDNRGYLIPFTDEIESELINRVCFVGNFNRGVIRGIHYHKIEWKIYALLHGAAKFLNVEIPEALVDQGDEDTIADYLKKNPSNISSYILSTRTPKILVIPPNRANGWVSLEENTNIIFISNLSFETAQSDDYRFSHTVVDDKYWGSN
jgi:dTDP-4-dehydrorhamnose 3,5-epimerase-like enzyme